MPPVGRQPWLHDLAITVDGNATAVSSPGGDLEPDSVQGLYVDDVRVLHRCELLVGDEPPTPVAWGARGARAEFFAAARGLGNAGADPSVEVHRVRTLDGAQLVEEVTVTSRAAEPVTAQLAWTLASDGLPIAAVKAGRVQGPVLTPGRDGDAVVFETGRHTVRVVTTPSPGDVRLSHDAAVLLHDITVSPGGSVAVVLRATTTRTTSSGFDADPGSAAVSWEGVRVEAADERLAVLVEHSLDDLRHLLLTDPLDPGDVFAAAGSPWYLTLFGRDSIWAARMMLPFGTELAGGTLRALARRQGAVDDPGRAEQPGKIAHEVRRTAYESPDGELSLPPLFYGTVDATALWVCLLVDAWRWGLPEAEVRDLLGPLRAALSWITTDGQPDADGFLRYLDVAGTGLVNQGWKDSTDSMRCRDGRIAPAPIALVEAQAYAVEALLGAADLLDALGETGGARARDDAHALTGRVRDAFWVDGDDGRYLALALDGAGAQVDGLGSNMGHALGTGALTAAEATSVTQTLTAPRLLDRFGIRTLADDNGGFNPIGYHTGSIWTHDTAVAALGMLKEGHDAEAAQVVRSLLSSGESFGYRWPELYSGLPMMGRPAPYPASCRPQAWSAASAGVLVTVALGLRADVPAGVLAVRPVKPAPFGALTVSGLRIAGAAVTVSVDDAGEVTVTGVPEGLRVVTTA